MSNKINNMSNINYITNNNFIQDDISNNEVNSVEEINIR